MTVDALERAALFLASGETSSVRCHRFASTISQPIMSATDPAMAITRRAVLGEVARFQMVEFTVATAPVASAAAGALDRPGTNRHGRSARTIPKSTLR
ncbi:hypothetical protein [Streptomyces sp. NPDC058664]|uniref:hypothetical protein n=1 Tax=unclassified Streptomyces TaxID=2593676 RepID=UPI00365DF116